MKLFLAGETPLAKVDGWKRDGIHIDPVQLESVIKRRLFSYYYHNDKGGSLDKEVRQSIKNGYDLFLDSGAYSAFTKKQEIKIEQYGRFILKYGPHFGVKANLDAIGDTGEISWDNLKRLEDMGCSVFPVFHYSDQEQYLTKILDRHYEFMALGGLVGASTKVLQSWLDHIWGNYLVRADGTPRINVHGFGLTSFPLMFRYPWFSVDSSSAVMTSIFGGCVFVINNQLMKIDFSEQSPTKRNLDSWHYSAMAKPLQDKVNLILEPYGITPKQLGEHYSYRHIINFDTFQRIEDLHHTTTFTIEQPTLF
jgi:hypothetical protein